MQAYEVHKTHGGVRDCGRFFLDLVGQFHRDSVTVDWHDRPRPIGRAVQELIDATWDKQTRKAHQTDRKLFNGRLCRLIDCASPGQGLRLQLGPVDFKTFLGTNLTHAHLRYEHGPDILGDALGVSAALQTDDDFLLLGRRSEHVYYHPGRIHPIGGVVEPPEAQGQAPCPFGTMSEELHQELGLKAGAIEEILCLGLVRDKHIVQPELIFDVKVRADVSELRAGAVGAKDSMEHDELLHVRDHPSSVISFIEANAAEMTAVAQAALLLHGLRHWGTGWFASARGYLRSMY